MWLKPENRCLVPANSFAEYAPVAALYGARLARCRRVRLAARSLEGCLAQRLTAPIAPLVGKIALERQALRFEDETFDAFRTERMLMRMFPTPSVPSLRWCA